MKTFEWIEHPPTLPLLEGGREVSRWQVAISGAGPAGLALACGLSELGIRTVVFEVDSSVCKESRSTAFTRRSAYTLDRLGVYKRILPRSLPWVGARTYFGNTEIMYQDFSPMMASNKYPTFTNITQWNLEQCFLDEISSSERKPEIRWQNRVSGVKAHESGVEIEVETPTGIYTTTADYLVACDGPRSGVLSALGLQRDGGIFDRRYVILDIELPGERPTERICWFNPPAKPGSVIMLHRLPDNVWRMDILLAIGETFDEERDGPAFLDIAKRQLAQAGIRGEGKLIWM
jgi:3-(3-hydroxy-phenyl)propionate hydroxylase